MTVLTGETGAGKSIIIDALGLLAGARGSAEYIRQGAKKTIISGQFSFPMTSPVAQVLQEQGFSQEELGDGIVLQRELHRTGRNVCRINGNLVNLTTLRAVGSRLIDIHGQNEHQELMHPENHLRLLDQYSPALKPLLQEYATRYAHYRKLNTALMQRQKNEKQWAQRLDMLQFQVDEIEAANLQPNEEEQLQQQKERLDNFQMIQTALQGSYQELTGGETDVVSHLGAAMSELEKIYQLDDQFAALHQKVADAFYNLQDVTHDLSDQIDALEWDEDRLNQVEQRLAMISQLKRKYGDSIPNILAYYRQIKAELAQMQANDQDSQTQMKAVAAAKQAAMKAAQQLATARRKVAVKLTDAVHEQLAQLYMDKAVFEVRFTPQSELTQGGLDSVEFYLQANPGETIGPLAKIASGGELSRIMLALKTIFAQQSGVTSIIFDEVDTGVSGRVAQAIAEKISQIAMHSQVLCITHLPQVAAIADHQYFIHKTVAHNRTTTHVTQLSQPKRVKEIARMLAGSQITTLTEEHAAELFKQAAKIKAKLAK